MTLLSDNDNVKQLERKMSDKFGTATLGAGCFWCVEAVFQDLRGVERVVSGYAGGSVKNPTYHAKNTIC